MAKFITNVQSSKLELGMSEDDSNSDDNLDEEFDEEEEDEFGNDNDGDK